MTLQQLKQVKQWLRLHGGRHPVELQVWDLVLTAWLLGWVGLPPSLLLHEWLLLPLCLSFWLLPELYTRWRSRLHRRGRLRCDWLTAL